MADYIDREKLYENEIPYINEHYTGVSEKPYKAMPVYSIKQIEAQPSVDAVEVVRCKECKFNDDGLCTKLCYIRDNDNFKQPLAVRDCYFCQWGVKKNEQRKNN